MPEDLSPLSASTQVSTMTGSTPPAAQDAPAQSSPPSFLDMVPQDYREKDWVNRFAKSDDPLGSFFKSYESAQSMLGSRVEVPKEGSTPEQIKAFHKAIGVPDSVDGYQYAAPDLSKEPEAVQKAWAERADNKFIDSMRQLALAQGIPAKQFNALAAALDEHNLAALKSEVEQQTQAEEAKRAADWDKFNKYFGEKATRTHEIAKEMAAKVIPADIAALGPDIALIHVLNLLNEKTADGRILSASSPLAPSSAGSKEAIRAEINKLREDPAYENKFDKRHAEVFSKAQELYKLEAELARQS